MSSGIIPVGLQIVLVVAAIAVLFFVISNSIKTKMDVRSAVLWVSWSIGILIIGIFPNIALWFANLIGIQYAVNFVFLIMIFFLFLFTYNTYVLTSKMNKEIKKLNYEIAILKKKVEDQK